MSQEYEQEVELVGKETVAYLSASVMIAALTGVLAWASIDVSVIPFSFQPFAVFFAGLLLGPLWGGFAMLLYVLVGLAGAPIFSSGGAGIGYFFGPTGGFLVGFIIAAVVIGAISHRSLTPRPFDSLSPVWTAIALVAALVSIYAIGIPWFVATSENTLADAATLMAPLVVGDLLKIALTVGVVAGGSEILDRF